ncbi:LysR family transcriptional regulator [Alteromonas antoniana]|uniref:LysR family transcriptional regulator n=1 Tax=Alteromonas antoniana TaxID=2803813 RepID=UPI001C479DC9|nr:LysR family transcriptional regulator [Alteromonas antoniana]
MARLNYHHFYYFWRVAKAENLSTVAKEIHLSQSAISAQLKQFQENIGLQLFTKQGRKLQLTPAGENVLRYAEDIFSKGEELEQQLRSGFNADHKHISIGILTNLSRNFIDNFISPLIADKSISFSLQSGSIDTLLDGLKRHKLDFILSNHSADTFSDTAPVTSELISKQPINIIGPHRPRKDRVFPTGYKDVSWVLPATSSEIRSAFSVICAQHGHVPTIKAETDDMAMLRLLARDTGCYTVMPSVVVKDEIAQNVLYVHAELDNIYEHFFAVYSAKKGVPDYVNALFQEAKVNTTSLS